MNTRRYRSEYKRGKADGYAEGYAQGLHDGNPFITLAEGINGAMATLSDKLSDPEFLEWLEKTHAIERQDTVAESCKELQEVAKEADNGSDQ